MRLSDLFPPTPEDPERLEGALKRARAIYGKSVEHFEERGIDTLFVAVGMASWTTASSSATPAAPVLLSPVSLTPRGAARADFDLSLKGDWGINGTLLHLLATEFSVDIDPEAITKLIEVPEAGVGPDSQAIFDRLEKEAGEIPEFSITFWQLSTTLRFTPTDLSDALGSGDRWSGGMQDVESFREHVVASPAMTFAGCQKPVRCAVEFGPAG